MALKSTFVNILEGSRPVGKIIFSKQMKLQIVNRPPLAIPLGQRPTIAIAIANIRRIQMQIQIQIPTIAIANIQTYANTIK